MTSKGINHEIKGKIKSKLQDFIKNNNEIKKNEKAKCNLINSRHEKVFSSLIFPISRLDDDHLDFELKR